MDALSPKTYATILRTLSDTFRVSIPSVSYWILQQTCAFMRTYGGNEITAEILKFQIAITETPELIVKGEEEEIFHIYCDEYEKEEQEWRKKNAH